MTHTSQLLLWNNKASNLQTLDSSDLVCIVNLIIDTEIVPSKVFETFKLMINSTVTTLQEPQNLEMSGILYRSHGNGQMSGESKGQVAISFTHPARRQIISIICKTTQWVPLHLWYL